MEGGRMRAEDSDTAQHLRRLQLDGTQHEAQERFVEADVAYFRLIGKVTALLAQAKSDTEKSSLQCMLGDYWDRVDALRPKWTTAVNATCKSTPVTLADPFLDIDTFMLQTLLERAHYPHIPPSVAPFAPPPKQKDPVMPDPPRVDLTLKPSQTVSTSLHAAPSNVPALSAHQPAVSTVSSGFHSTTQTVLQFSKLPPAAVPSLGAGRPSLYPQPPVPGKPNGLQNVPPQQPLPPPNPNSLRKLKGINYGRNGSPPDEMDVEELEQRTGPFMSAREKLDYDDRQKLGGWGARQGGNAVAVAVTQKVLGTKRRGFVPPFLPKEEKPPEPKKAKAQDSEGREINPEVLAMMEDPRMKGCDPQMVEMIMNDIIERDPDIDWNDIAGLGFVKKTVKEVIIHPLLRPDLFTGLRAPPKGLLLFGPPGTGKTMVGKAIASKSKSTFFNISAASLTSKWIGEGEKMVKTLFAVARYHQPAVIFIDEIDSLLTQRSDTENEASRRIKTEFFIQLDGAANGHEERLLLIGATNRPQELDDAARRRMVKRLYIPLPDVHARRELVSHLLSRCKHALDDAQIQLIAEKTDGYSGADIKALSTEAALGPIRACDDIETVNVEDVRPILLEDFTNALQFVRPSVSQNDLKQYVVWNREYGSFHDGS